MKLVFKKSSIPNYLTIFRMVLVPVIVIMLLIPAGPYAYSMLNPLQPDSITPYSVFDWFYIAAGILFVVASLTDAIDGFLARKYKWVSDFGKLWDPIADKVLINSTLICFGFIGLIPIWVVVIMIARDVIVDASRMLAASKNIVVAANFFGKIKTVTQIIAIIFIFFFFCGKDSTVDPILWWAIQNLMIFVALFFSIMSGVIYLFQIQKKISRSKKTSVQ